MLPAFAMLDTCTVPFTYSRNVVPSKVSARCVHVLAGRADVP